MHRPLLILVRLYRWLLSPLKGVLFGPFSGCRHVPSCSAYAEEALQVHGAGRGLWLTVRRVARCHPWGTSGWDPVPPRTDLAGAGRRGACPKCAGPGHAPEALPVAEPHSFRPV